MLVYWLSIILVVVVWYLSRIYVQTTIRGRYMSDSEDEVFDDNGPTKDSVLGDEAHHKRMARSLDRYQKRFLAVHGKFKVENKGDLDADRFIYGDLVKPEVLNAWNSYYVRKYIELFLERLPEEFSEESMVEELAPVMAGMFEQVFLHGLMFEQEVDVV